MMSYFQIAADRDKASYQDIDKCLKEIVEAGIRIAEQERFCEDNSLIGYNVYIDDVKESIERKWQRKISRIIEKSAGRIDHRFRFKDISY